MLWNKDKDILMMRRMASKVIFESKSGSRERGAIWQNIANNLNNCKEFAVTAQSIQDYYIILMAVLRKLQGEP